MKAPIKTLKNIQKYISINNESTYNPRSGFCLLPYLSEKAGVINKQRTCVWTLWITQC